MNRTTILVVAGLLLAALIAWTTTRNDDAAAPRLDATIRPTTAATAARDASREAVDRQRDLAPADGRAERRRARRMVLLDVARTRAWEAHGVAVFAGPFDTRTRTQSITVTPSGAMTLVEIGRAVARICRELGDRCSPKDYRFVVVTTSGSVPLAPALFRAVRRPRRVAPRPSDDPEASYSPSNPGRPDGPRSHRDDHADPGFF